MNKNRKGFTIVELVIVIAIIAILAAVLIPTFASLIARRMFLPTHSLSVTSTPR